MVKIPVRTTHAYGLIAATVLTWAIGVVIARAVHQEIPPIGLSFWRWIIATLILLPFIWRSLRQNIQLVIKNLGYFWIQGIFMTGGGMFLFLAVNFTTAINVALVNATQPILTVLIAWILIRDEIKSIQILGIVAAFIGITVMVTKADFRVLVNLDFNVGDFITVLATAFYACYAINIRKMPKEIGTFTALFVILLMGSLTLFPFYMAEAVFIRPTPFSGKLVIVVLVLALLVSILSLAMWNTGNAVVGHNRAAIFVNLMPVYSAILAIYFLDERLYFFHVIGALFVCAGIFMVVRKD
jgi:drug/metabolite transporter (DMT)-like permease